MGELVLFNGIDEKVFFPSPEFETISSAVVAESNSREGNDLDSSMSRRFEDEDESCCEATIRRLSQKLIISSSALPSMMHLGKVPWISKY